MTLEELKSIEPVSLDFYNTNIKTINAKQYDTKSRYVRVSFTNHGKKVKLNPATMTAFVRFHKPDGYGCLNTCTILDDGTVVFELTQQMLAASGRGIADIMIYDSLIVMSVNEDGDGEIPSETVTLYDFEVSDDDDGNVVITSDDNKTVREVYTIDYIEDILSMDIPVLSTMNLYVNIVPSAINHAEVESSYEYNALISAETKCLVLEETLQANEEERIASENSRVAAEQSRVNAENSRTSAENVRVTKEKERQNAETERKNAETLRQQRIQEIETARENGEFDGVGIERIDTMRGEMINPDTSEVIGVTNVDIVLTDSTSKTFVVHDGVSGKSAYQYAQDGGFAGTESEFTQQLANLEYIINGNEVVY